MRFKNKATRIGYAILCIVLTAGLIWGIYFIVDVGKKYDENTSGIIGGADGPTDIYIESGNSSDSSGSSSSGNSSYSESDIIDSYVYHDDGNMKEQQISTDVDSYEIDIPYGKVTILPTDKPAPYITYSGDHDIEVRVREENRTCKISMSAKGFNLLDFDEDKIAVVLLLPQEKLRELDVDFDAGSLNIIGIKADHFSLDMSAGNAAVSGCEFDRIETDLDAGNLTLYSYSGTTSIKSDVDAGNMKLLLPEDISGFDLRYSTDLGNISDKLSFDMESSSQGHFISKEGKLSYGDKSCKIALDVDIGNISLDEYTK